MDQIVIIVVHNLLYITVSTASILLNYKAYRISVEKVEALWFL